MADRQIVSFDWAIKNILRDKANFDILEGFIQALLKEKVTIERMIEGESNQSDRNMKFNRVDILAINSKDEHIIIEVQYAPEKSFFKRLLFGTSNEIVDNIKSGDDYENIKKVYSVSIVYFDIEIHNSNTDRVDYVYHGKLDFTGFHNNKLVKLDTNCMIGYDSLSHEDVNVFPEYFIIPVSIFNNNVNDELDEWIYAFKNNKVKDNFSAPGIQKMGVKMDYLSMTAQQKREYDKYLFNLASDRDVLQFNADMAEQKGLRKGIEQGIKQMSLKVEQAEQDKQRAEQDKNKSDTKAQQMYNILKKTGMSDEDIQKELEL